MIKIFKPIKRGIGGTMAFPVSVNGLDDVLEMNDDCVWEPTYKIWSLSIHIIYFISDLIESTLIPLLSTERKNKDISNGDASQSSQCINFIRFLNNKACPEDCCRVSCKINQHALYF